jgi:hypothetical protein
MKKASKARNREGEKGQWWPCNLTEFELKALQEEGFLALGSCRFLKDSSTLTPEDNERVLTKAWVERGLSLPPSDFFLVVLHTYGLQPHNICPNAYLILSNFVTLCKGHLGVRPDIWLLQFFYRVEKETKEKSMINYGSMTFVLRPKRIYPPISSHESIQYWNARWFYIRNEIVPDSHQGLPIFANNPPEELDSWSYIPNFAQHPELEKMAHRISKLVNEGLTGMDLTLSWFTRRIQPLRYNRRLICAYTGVDDPLRVTKNSLPADSLNKRIHTLVKVVRGQVVPEISKDIHVNGNCPPVSLHLVICCLALYFLTCYIC